MASELAIYYTPMHFMWGVKSGATPGVNWSTTTSHTCLKFDCQSICGIAADLLRSDLSCSQV